MEKYNTGEINGINIQDRVIYYNETNTTKVLSWLDIDLKHNFYWGLLLELWKWKKKNYV